MLSISFGWTWPALIAGAKTVTRRDWKKEYALKFKKGVFFHDLNRDWRYGGKPIAVCQMAEDARLESISETPESDYKAEGFEFFHRNPRLLPRKMPYDVSPAGFEAWRRSGEIVCVIRFRVEKILDRRLYAHIMKQTQGKLL